MSPEQLAAALASGDPAPVYVVLGDERYLRNRALQALRKASGVDAIPGLNDDDFTAGETPIARIVAAARTLPMMARLRWVAVREVERWDGKGGAEGRTEGLDLMASFVREPVPSTLLVLSGTKLAAKNPVLVAAKARAVVVDCDPLPRQALGPWLLEQTRARKASISRGAAELLIEVIGSDLSTLEDVLERLSLFVGAGAEITEETVDQVIPVVRPATVWELLDAIGQRRVGAALAALGKVFDPADRGLRLLGLVAWSTRQWIRYVSARQRGLAVADAAKAAGVPPFKARDLEATAQHLSLADLEQWLAVLREVDLALKGGSRRPAQAILESAVIQLCGAGTHPALQRA